MDNISNNLVILHPETGPDRRFLLLRRVSPSSLIENYTNGWLTPGSSDFTAGIHPSDSGHLKVAARLQPIIAPYLTGGAPSIANSAYKIVCRNDGPYFG